MFLLAKDKNANQFKIVKINRNAFIENINTFYKQPKGRNNPAQQCTTSAWMVPSKHLADLDTNQKANYLAFKVLHVKSTLSPHTYSSKYLSICLIVPLYQNSPITPSKIRKLAQVFLGLACDKIVEKS